MKGLVVRIAVTAAALWVAIWLVPGLDFTGSSWWSYLGVTALIVLVNTFARPIFNILSLPFILLTFGLFLLVTNALALQLAIWLSSEVFSLGLTSTGFFWATFLGAIVMSITSMILTKILD